MKKFISYMGAVVIALTASSLFVSSATAADKPNLLIMGEDADKDTVPRNSRVFKRVLAAVTDQMNQVGFDVYDETAVTLDNFKQGRTRRTDAELIDIARSIQRPPIDVAVFYSIYASINKKSYTSKVKVRIEGRMLHAKTGQFLGNFEEISPREWNAPADCTRECVLEIVGKYSKILANELGAVLAEKLAWLANPGVDSDHEGIPNAYTLIFDNFTPEEMLDIEEYLVIFSGYKSHRPIYSSQTRAELWYESDIKSAKLNRNLTKMLERLDLRGVVKFSGNTYTIKKITLRNKKRKQIVRDEW